MLENRDDDLFSNASELAREFNSLISFSKVKTSIIASNVFTYFDVGEKQ